MITLTTKRTILSIAILCGCVFGLPAACKAQLFYNFVEFRTDEVLATLELAGLPATPVDLVSLTFTPEGEMIFGLGLVYDGEFDSIDFSTVSENLPGVLGCTDCDETWANSIFDNDPPLNGTVLELLFNNVPDSDVIAYFDEALNFRGARGEWTSVVPEPSTMVLLVTGLCGGGWLRRRKR